MPQTLTFFGHSNVPLGVAVLLDTSASMEQTLPVAQEAAIAFARTLRTPTSRPSSISTHRQDRTGLYQRHRGA